MPILAQAEQMVKDKIKDQPQDKVTFDIDTQGAEIGLKKQTDSWAVSAWFRYYWNKMWAGGVRGEINWD